MDNFQDLEIFQIVGSVLDRMQKGDINIRKNANDIGIPADRMYKWTGRGQRYIRERHKP